MKETEVEYYHINYKADKNGFVSKPHSHQHYEIFYFEKGEASHFIDFEEHPITDNSCFLVAHNQVHYITAKPNTHNIGHVLSIQKEVVELLDNELFQLFGTFAYSSAFNLENDPFLPTLFQQIQKELQNNHNKSFEVVFNFIKILMTYILRQSETDKTNSPKDRDFRKFIDFLEIHFAQIRSVLGYANLLNITPKQLNRVCKTQSNKTALFYIHDRINLEAKRKLFYSENQVKDICYALGFEDAAHFNNFFKKMNHQTPLEFRKEMSQIFN